MKEDRRGSCDGRLRSVGKIVPVCAGLSTDIQDSLRKTSLDIPSSPISYDTYTKLDVLRALLMKLDTFLAPLPNL